MSNKLKYTVIKSKEQLKEYCSILKNLSNQTLIPNYILEEIELLLVLIEQRILFQYDENDNGDTVGSRLKYIMNEHKLNFDSMIFLLKMGKEDYVKLVDILNDELELTSEQISLLSKRFKLRPEYFKN